jgi:hypothetical protein
MDAERFDTLARALTEARSRRGALTSLLGGTLGLLGLAGTAAKKKKGKGKKGKGKKKPTCRDRTKNGSETDVDCGGRTCPRCAVGKKCKSRNDCESALCSGGRCQACTESPETCGDVNGAPCFCSGEAKVCSNGVTSGPVSECESCPRDSICQPDGTKIFCAERCVGA